MLNFNSFWEWLINSGAITIPTLGTQDGSQDIEILNLPANQNPETGFFTIQAGLDGGGAITVPSGNTHNFDREIAQRTWDRFFGLLSTTARANGFHFAGRHVPSPLPQLFSHQMASSYTYPPNPAQSLHLHHWFDCPNTIPCVFIAATIRVFLVSNLPAGHILRPFV